MKEDVHLPKAWISRSAYVKSMDDYEKMYRQSIDSPAEFWSDEAKQFHWETPIDKEKFLSYNFNVNDGPVYVKWFEGASTNICYNLLDRNIRLGNGDKIAYYWLVTKGFMRPPPLPLLRGTY